MSRHVDYTKNALVITMQTSDPAALHDQLLKGLVNSMRNYIDSDDRSDGQHSLVSLLENLLPEEKELAKICS